MKKIENYLEKIDLILSKRHLPFFLKYRLLFLITKMPDKLKVWLIVTHKAPMHIESQSVYPRVV